MTTIVIPINASTPEMVDRQLRRGLKFHGYGPEISGAIRFEAVPGKWLSMAPSPTDPMICMVEVDVDVVSHGTPDSP